MRANRIVSCVAMALAAVAATAEPYIGFIYPAAVRSGEKTRLLIGGQDLGKVCDAYVSGSGVRVVDIEPVPGFPSPDGSQLRHLQAWLEAIRGGSTKEPAVPPKTDVSGWRSNRWWMALGSLDAGKLDIVRRDLYTPRNALQATPSLSGKLLLTLEVEHGARTGVRFVNLISPRGISAPRPILVVAMPVVAEPPFRVPSEPEPAVPCVTGFPATLVGQVYPGETDAFSLKLPAGARLTAAVCARELQPCIGDAVPGFFNPILELEDAAGRRIACADDRGFSPDPILVAKTPAAGRYTLKIHDVLYRGRGDFGYAIRVATQGGVPQSYAPFRAEPPEPAGFFVATGAVERAGARCAYAFSVPAPGTYVFETLARRGGSPLDPVMTLYRGTKAEGKPLAVWDDVTNAVHVGSVLQAECDPVGCLTLGAAGDYTLTVADRATATGPFIVAVRRPVPSFDVYSLRSAVLMKHKSAASIPLKVVRREGFRGAIRLAASAGFEVKPGVIPAGADAFTIRVSCSRRKWNVPQTFAITAEADGVPAREVVPADEYEQAFAWKHLLPAPSFVAFVVRRSKFGPFPWR